MCTCNGHNTLIACVGHNTLISCAVHNTTIACHSHNTVIACHSHNTVIACTGHNTTVACHSHVGTVGVGPCTTNLSTFTDPVLDTNVKVKAIHINELRAAIDDERVRRGSARVWNGATIAAGSDIIDDNDVKSLRDALEAVAPARSWPLVDAIVEGSSAADDSHISEIRSNVNITEGECLCHCNYACTCNCNYACTCYCNYACTCNCNYACTCNCNYGCTCYCNYGCTCYCNYTCTCNCNYACVCNCNYSDETLKTDIVYI